MPSEPKQLCVTVCRSGYEGDGVRSCEVDVNFSLMFLTNSSTAYFDFDFLSLKVGDNECPSKSTTTTNREPLLVDLWTKCALQGFT